jgi:hypothetical protein
MSVVTAVALISAVYVFQQRFRHPKSCLARTLTYFVLGFTTFLPGIHLIHLDEQTLYQGTILISYRNLAALNSLGVLLYRTGLLTALQILPQRQDQRIGLLGGVGIYEV